VSGIAVGTMSIGVPQIGAYRSWITNKTKQNKNTSISQQLLAEKAGEIKMK